MRHMKDQEVDCNRKDVCFFPLGQDFGLLLRVRTGQVRYTSKNLCDVTLLSSQKCTCTSCETQSSTCIAYSHMPSNLPARLTLSWQQLIQDEPMVF